MRNQTLEVWEYGYDVKNNMKRFWNYLFYFTLQVNNVVGYYCIEKPFDYLFGLSKFWDKHNKRGKEKARNGMGTDPHYGFNIRSAFSLMLIITEIICVCIVYALVVFFDLDIKNRLSAITVLIIIFLPAYLFNEFVLGWHKKTYLTYFKELERTSDKRLGYLITLCFHLGVILLGILMFI